MSGDHHVFRTARFNTKNEHEAQVVDIIKYYEEQQPRISFKDLVVDAILRFQGIDPVLFQKGDYPYRKPVTAEEVRGMLAELQQPSGITLDDVAALIERIPQPEPTGISRVDLEQTLEAFAAQLLRQLKQTKTSGRGRSVIEDDEDDETVSTFAKNFARGFMQRQSKGRGEDDDE